MMAIGGVIHCAADIEALYRKCHTPKHVRAHMKIVARLAVKYARCARRNGYSVDVPFTRQLALVHDLMKAVSFKTYEAPRTITLHTTTPHASPADLRYWKKLKRLYPNKHDVEITAAVLKTHRASTAKKTGAKKTGARRTKHQTVSTNNRLARAVLSQQFDAVISKTHPLKTLEERIVYYADKRVAHTNIVTLAQRFKEGRSRYYPHYPAKKIPPREEQKLHKIESAVYKLERELKPIIGC